ncbi:MAG: hypothetical protein ACHQM6_10575, partial [Candidatus Kapaibacterium sp.]
VLYQMTNNSFSFTPDPQSISHFVFLTKPNASVAGSEISDELRCTNNLSGSVSNIRYHVSNSSSIRIFDIEGRIIKQYDDLFGTGGIEFSGISGVYEVILTDGSKLEHNKIVITN